MTNAPTKPVLQLRVALTSRDYERLLRFYCAGLGLDPAQVWTQESGRGLMLELGEGTLELFDEEYADYIDGLEVGARVSGSEVAQLVKTLDRPDFRRS
jgi:catechol 2,3-dioxygenase-like lactoylglutathione lyase family enzyme